MKLLLIFTGQLDWICISHIFEAINFDTLIYIFN